MNHLHISSADTAPSPQQHHASGWCDWGENFGNHYNKLDERFVCGYIYIGVRTDNHLLLRNIMEKDMGTVYLPAFITHCEPHCNSDFNSLQYPISSPPTACVLNKKKMTNAIQAANNTICAMHTRQTHDPHT